VEVRTDDGTLVILDCGTGIRELGLELLRTRPAPYRIYLLIGHTHWDHIQGFPFFTPAFLPGTELNIYAPAGFQRSLEDSLSGQMQYSYFPVKLTDLPSRIHFTELEEGFFRIGDVLVETQYLNHTAPTIAYRLSSGGASVAYVTDHEPFWNSPGPVFNHPGDQRHITFLKDADLVIHDAQYTSEEYRTKLGWGHSPIDYATDIAVAAGVSRLALFHHDPTHDDEIINILEQGARDRAAGAGVDVFAAAEGMAFHISGRGSAVTVAEVSALEMRQISGSHVLIISDNAADVLAIGQVLAEDELILTQTLDGRSALDQALNVRPDLVIMNSRLQDGQGASYIQPLRSLLEKVDLPIILLTDGRQPGDTLYSAESIATDYLAKPFSPPMLRTRVRAWLARTMGIANSHHDAVAPPQPAPAEPVEVVADLGSAPTAKKLASVTLFRSLSNELLETLLSHSQEQVFAPGQTVVRQGESTHAVYVILSGRVRIVEAVPDSPVEMFLGELGQDEVFGELGILRERPRSATVLTLEETTCLIVPENDFLEVLHKSPEMSMALLRLVAGRLYNADRLLARYAPDPLTGLPGRRAFHYLYRRLTAGARRRGSSVLLLAIDVVHLKAINDEFGYNVGDDVLRTVGDTLVESSRSTDLIARYGGDEFAALLLDAGENDVEIVINRVQQKLHDMAIQRNLPLIVSCKIGFAVSHTPPDTADDLLRDADQDMQTRKYDRRQS
jgi:diguanylate cyclase (GGDEF)-like protein